MKKHKRKNICMLLIIAMLLGLGTNVHAHAQEAEKKEQEFSTIRYEHTMRVNAGVTFIDGTAHVLGSVTGYPDRTTKINAFLYLQRKTDSGWMVVKTWTDSVNDWTLDITGEHANLSSGTFRVRFVTYVYEGSESEEVIYLSDEVVFKKP